MCYTKAGFPSTRTYCTNRWNMSIPRYDIFRGHPSKDAMWLEALDSLAVATYRMAEHARQKPGPYFIFCHTNRLIVASVDTSMTDAAKA
jgi:hypothetical protein